MKLNNTQKIAILLFAWMLLGKGVVSSVAPISAPGLHVLVVYDSSKTNTLEPKQLSALNSNRVPAYVTSKNGKFNRFDTKVEQTNMDPIWKAALARPRASLPWVIVSNAPNKGGIEAPLPNTDEEFLSLVKKYGE